MKIKNHRLFSVIMLTLGTVAFVAGYSQEMMILPTLIGTFCWCIGWYQWKLGGDKGPVSKKKRDAYNLKRKLIGLVMIVVGILFLIASFTETVTMDLGCGLGALILVFGIVIFRQGNPEKSNSDVMGLMQVNELETDMDTLYASFKDVDTTLGKPWLSHVSTITDRDCIIWGPTRNGSFVFGYYLSGIFQLSNSQDINWIRDREAAYAHMLHDVSTTDDQNLSNYSLDMDIRYLVSFYYEMLKNYALTGVAAWRNGNADAYANGKVYAFDESFAWTKQIYHLVDTDGNIVFNVEGTFPLKTFKISDPSTGKEIFKITKRLIHIMDHYDFYYNGEFFGEMAQKVDFLHDRFELDTPLGHVKMQSDNGSLGNNSYIYMNDELIGTVAQKLGLKIRNAVFDNYVIHVFDDKYLALIAGMAIMAEREHKRDQYTSSSSDWD